MCKPHRVEGRLDIKELISRTRCRICREKGQWARECQTKGKHVTRHGEEAKPSLFVSFGGLQYAPCYIGQEVVDTGYSRFWIGQTTLGKLERMLTEKWSLHIQKIEVEKAMTFRFSNDETLRTRTMAILLVGIAGVNGALRVYVVPGGAPLLLSKEFLKNHGCHIVLDRGTSVL